MNDIERSVIAENFWPKVDRRSEGECWHWQGSRSRDGYGLFYWGGTHRAHRIAVELDGREIAKGRFIDHKCRNRSCVNPNHLRVVTPRQNTLENSESVAAANAVKTYCDNGHELSLENVRMRRKDYGGFERVCRSCHYENMRRSREIKRARAKGEALDAAILPRFSSCREEADAMLPYFGERWETLREIGAKFCTKTPFQLATRARDLRLRGLVETRSKNHMLEWRIALADTQPSGETHG